MDALESLPASFFRLEDPLIKAEEEEDDEEEDRAPHVSSGCGSDDEEEDPSTSAPAAKRRKKNTLDLSDVPMNLAPLLSEKSGSASKFKGVSKQGKKWEARIHILSEGGQVNLGTFDSEEEAGIMHARARYKYPAPEQGSWMKKPCPLDLREVPMNLPPIPQDRSGSASRFKGVRKQGEKWAAQIKIPSEGGKVHLGTFDSEDEAGIMYARARFKYPIQG